jgi:hypothetical protein
LENGYTISFLLACFLSLVGFLLACLLHRPYKFQKASVQYDEQGTSWNRHCAKYDELSCNKEFFQQLDLVEDSNTFKQQVRERIFVFFKSSQ